MEQEFQDIRLGPGDVDKTHRLQANSRVYEIWFPLIPEPPSEWRDLFREAHGSDYNIFTDLEVRANHVTWRSPLDVARLQREVDRIQGYITAANRTYRTLIENRANAEREERERIAAALGAVRLEGSEGGSTP